LLHDSELVGIDFNKNQKILKLKFQAYNSGEVTFVEFKSIKNFKIENFREQNVVLDFFEVTARSAPSYKADCIKELDLVDNFFELIGQQKVFFLEPSVGAAIWCSCESFTITESTQ
jgi:hypothetical protein